MDVIRFKLRRRFPHNFFFNSSIYYYYYCTRISSVCLSACGLLACLFTNYPYVDLWISINLLFGQFKWNESRAQSGNGSARAFMHLFCVERTQHTAGAETDRYIQTRSSQNKYESARIVCVHCSIENYDGLGFDLCARQKSNWMMKVFTQSTLWSYTNT